MRIGIDARLYKESGVGRYIRNLINNLVKLDDKNEGKSSSTNEYIIFLLKKDIDEVNLPSNWTKVEADFKWYGLSEQIKFPKLLESKKLDLVHFPHFNVPIFYKGKFMVTIHDLIHQHFQMRRATTKDPFTYWVKHLGYKMVLSKALKNSVKVITVSEYVKDEIVRRWKLDPKKVVVTLEGVEENILNLVKKLEKKDVNKCLEKFDIKPPYIFYIGNAHPHKNVEGLIKAFLKLRKKYQYLTLALAGHDHYFWKRIQEENKHKDIKYLGYVSDEEMVCLYKGAQAFVQPSFEEGFGIPPLEAMACNCPVVSSNKGSLPEVGGEACIYFDPYNLEDMQQKIESVLNSNKLRNELIEKGEKHYKKFSWKKLAEQTLDLYTNIKT